MDFNIFKDASGYKIRRKCGEDIFWRISAYCLVIKENKILCNIPTWHNLYELPGGGIEPDESLIEGIVRECYEETGYSIQIKSMTPFYTNEENFYHLHENKYYHSLIFAYLAKLKHKNQNKDAINKYDGNEIKEVLWVDMNKFTQKNTHRIVYPVIKLYRKEKIS
jgi:8-oxo-dGTP pyrophosphatase MutT (NUDIX family)